MIYAPGEDSFLLSSSFSLFIKPGMDVLDVGCGSGYLMKEALKFTSEVQGVDINPQVIAHCRAQKLNVYQSDLFESVTGKFDIVVFNPPYLPEDVEEDDESRLITTGGKEGYELLERFLRDVKSFLKPSGVVLLVVSSLTGDVGLLFSEYKLNYTLLKEESHFFEKLRVYVLTQ